MVSARADINVHSGSHRMPLPPEETVRELSCALGVSACFLTQELRLAAAHPALLPDDSESVTQLETGVRQRLAQATPLRRTRVLGDERQMCVGPVWDPDTDMRAGYVVVPYPAAQEELSTIFARVEHACAEIAQWLQYQHKLEFARKDTVREVALAVLAESTSSSGFWTDKLRSLGVPLAPFYRPAVLRQLVGAAEPADPAGVLHLLRDGLERHHSQLYVGRQSNECYAVFFPDEHLGGRLAERAADMLRRELRRLDTTLEAGFVAILAEHSVGADVVSRVFQKLVRIVPVALREETEPVVRTPEYYALQCLLGSLDPQMSSQYVTSIVGSLLDHDAAHDSRLLRTLAAYVEEGCSVNRTASRLFSHRNTVRRHLERAEEVLGLSLTDSGVCFRLLLATTLLCYGGSGYEQACRPTPAEHRSGFNGDSVA